MGGTVGIGILIIVFGLEFFVQFAFKLFKFDVREVQHRFIDDYIRVIKDTITEKKEDANSCL